MSCPSELELVALVEGDLTETRARAVRAHAEGCTGCAMAVAALEEVAHGLRTDVPGALGGVSPEAFADDVVARLSETRPAPPSRRAHMLPRLAAAAALVLAAGGGYRIVAARDARPGGGDAWVARGTERASRGPAERAIVRFGSVASGVFAPLRDGARLRPDAAIVAEVGNTDEASLYLLAFLVDSGGERHWIYPAYEVGASPPSAMPLPRTAEPRVLATMVRLDAPAAGRARLVAIVLSAPDGVDHVEQAPADELTRERLAAHYPGALVVETILTVETP